MMLMLVEVHTTYVPTREGRIIYRFREGFGKGLDMDCKQNSTSSHEVQSHLAPLTVTVKSWLEEPMF